MNHDDQQSRVPITEQSMVSGDEPTTSWASACDALATASTYWLATSRPDGRPHVMRVLGVRESDSFYVATSPVSRKGRNLAGNPNIVLSATNAGLDLVVEGSAQRVKNDLELTQVAEAYAEKYGWHVTVRHGAFHDADGAPTAGPPPYHVFRVNPAVAFSFGADDNRFAPTRWTFAPDTR